MAWMHTACPRTTSAFQTSQNKVSSIVEAEARFLVVCLFKTNLYASKMQHGRLEFGGKLFDLEAE